MNGQPKVINAETIAEIRLKNIVDVGLTVSAMIRLFEKGTKDILREPALRTLKKVFEVKSEPEFQKLHSRFCKWGVREIILSKKSKKASYGQIAKVLDVVLKVAIYYCRLPECEKSKELSQWLNAAVDTKMMAELRSDFPKAMRSWPQSIEGVADRRSYTQLQKVVREFIRKKYQCSITPVQYDDYRWRKLNR